MSSAEFRTPIIDAPEALAVGGVTLDLNLPYGEISSDHDPSSKGTWHTWQSELPGLLERTMGEKPDVVTSVGGNPTNAIVDIKDSQAYESAGILCFLGTDEDPISKPIRDDLQDHGIQILAGPVSGYNPSVAKIERLGPGSDRHQRGRKRDPIDQLLTPELIRSSTKNARLLLMSSLGSAALVARMLANTTKNTFSTYIPNQHEIDDPDLIDALQQSPASMIGANNTELANLIGDVDRKLTPEELIKKISKLKIGERVLCTLGSNGSLYMSESRELYYEPARLLPPKLVACTLGLGDKFTATVARGIEQGKDPQLTLRSGAEATSELAQIMGAHVCSRVRPLGTRQLIGT